MAKQKYWNGTTWEVVGTEADKVSIADSSNLFSATDVEGALKELFTNVSNGKSLVGGAITDVDDSVVIPTDPTFQELANAIGGISSGLKTATGIVQPIGDTPSTISVTGLDFYPKFVLAYGKQSGYSKEALIVLNRDKFTVGESNLLGGWAVGSSERFGTYSFSSVSEFMYQGGFYFEVPSNFLIPSFQAPPIPLEWVAIGE
jgi:hypothetical protein